MNTKKNVRGFTLIELLGVLIIIGILSLIIIPSVSTMLKEQRQDEYNKQIESIVIAAKNYGTDNINLLPAVEGDYIEITLGQLKETGYIKSVINPLNNKDMPDCLTIKITKVSGTHDYEYVKNSENSSC